MTRSRPRATTVITLPIIPTKTGAMENNKNVLIAIVLSAAIIIAWTLFVQGPHMEK